MAVKHVSLESVAKEHGVENLRVFFVTSVLNTIPGLPMAFTSSSDAQVVVEGRIRQGVPNRDVLGGYKFIVQPLDESYAYQEYYNDDFESMSHQCPDSWYIMVGEERVPLHFVEVVE